MKTGTKMVVGTIVVGGLGASAFAVLTAGGGETEVDTVAVERGEIVDRALAVGRIEPLVEVSVKSQLAGVVRRMFKEPGQYVHRGEPLLEVQPNPTPIELVEARRAIELREIELQQLDRRRDRLAALRDQELASEEEFEDAEYSFSEVSLQLQIARERLALLSGTVDEIDVGRLTEGMPVEVTIGALPDARVEGRLTT